MSMPDSGEIMVEWKEEIPSPNGGPSFLFEDEWLDFDEKPAINNDTLEKSATLLENPTRAQIASQLLEELELVPWIKEEPFQDWLEEKIELPIFDELVSSEPVIQNRSCVPLAYPSINKQQLTQQYQQYHLPQQEQVFQQLQHQNPQHHQLQLSPDTTQSLLQEFETVLGDVEACHQGVVPSNSLTLTPPQSPPPTNQTLISLQPIQQHLQQPIQHRQVSNYVYNQNGQQQIIELLNQQNPQTKGFQTIDQGSSSPLEFQNQWGAEKLSVISLLIPDSPQSSEVSTTIQHDLADVEEYVRSCAEDASPSSPFASSSEQGSCDDSSEDPDWLLDDYSNTSRYSKDASSLISPSPPARAGRRPRPYMRPSPDDKRVRKKEQNKNAATRYRQKKKQEIKEILSEEQELVVKNEKLNAKVGDLQREIGYLKGLMRDLCKAKGLLK